MGTPFKMKGSPFQRNYGIGSPLHEDKPVESDDKVVNAGTKETVTVSGGDKPERHADKFARVKKETSAVTLGDNEGKLANLAKEYGGTWKREDRSAMGGSKGTFVNEKGETVKQVAINQGQAKNKEKREYIAANETKN